MRETVALYHPTLVGRYLELLAPRFPGLAFVPVSDEASAREALRRAEILLAQITFPGRLLGEAPRLRWIQVMGAGVDALVPHVPDEVRLSRFTGSLGPRMAEYAIGAFAALHLARAGHGVVVLERNVPGVEASGTNAGSLGAQNKPVRLGALSVEAIEAWRGFETDTGLDAGYHRTGGFRVAENEAGVERLREIAAAQSAVGVPIEHIDGDEARRRAPYLSAAVLAANFCPLDGHNNALTASALVALAARQAGARIVNGVTVQRIEQETDGSHTVHTDRGVVGCDRLILSAGVWSRDFLVAAGIDLPVVLRINQMMVTEPAPPLLEHVIFHVDGHLTLKQVRPAMSCLVGGGWPGGGDYRSGRKETLLASTLGNAAVALRIVPALARLRVLRSWSGFDWRTADQMPVIGEAPGRAGMFVCTSCFGGYTLSPLLGRGLAQAATTGLLPPELEPFSPANTLARLAPTLTGAVDAVEMASTRGQAVPS